ncbi:MAG: hypothetical protein Q4A82_00680 [Corynebacterium sp.]|nr:hypothetical protein [Corynebacterium sp.]
MTNFVASGEFVTLTANHWIIIGITVALIALCIFVCARLVRWVIKNLFK